MKPIKALMAIAIAILVPATGLFAQNKAGRKDSTRHARIHYTCPMHPDVVSDMPGKCPKCNKQLMVDRRGSKQANFVYTCSMHPDVTSDKPGKCPKCGMEMVKKGPAATKAKKDSTHMKMKM